jgi:hypothetical protein
MTKNNYYLMTVGAQKNPVQNGTGFLINNQSIIFFIKQFAFQSSFYEG